MFSTASPAENEQYLYEQGGLRRQKTNASGTTVFTIDDPNVLLETTPTGMLVARYTQNPDGYGGLASQNQSGTSSFHGFDSQMASRILVSVSGLVTDSYSFKAFGEELQSGSGTTNPHRYGAQVGYYRDAANIMQIGQRKLLAATGRWGSRDPLRHIGPEASIYGYAANSPNDMFDPTGLLCGQISALAGMPGGGQPSCSGPSYRCVDLISCASVTRKYVSPDMLDPTWQLVQTIKDTGGPYVYCDPGDCKCEFVCRRWLSLYASFSQIPNSRYTAPNGKPKSFLQYAQICRDWQQSACPTKDEVNLKDLVKDTLAAINPWFAVGVDILLELWGGSDTKKDGHCVENGRSVAWNSPKLRTESGKAGKGKFTTFQVTQNIDIHTMEYSCQVTGGNCSGWQWPAELVDGSPKDWGS